MTKRRQNLILFYETIQPFLGENIGSKLVNSYMNAFCIDEDDQSDIDAIFNIPSLLPYLEYREMGYYEEPWREKMIMSGSMNSMIRKTSTTDIHLIIQTSIYTLRDEMTCQSLNDPIVDMIVNWISTLSTVSSYDRVVVTLLHGGEIRSCSKDEVKIAYQRSNSEKQKIFKCSSFQDDLEKFHNYLRSDAREEYATYFEWLFMFKMSNDETKIEKLKSFQESTFLSGPSSYSQLEQPFTYNLFEQLEAELDNRYIQYYCSRFTFEVPK